MALVARRTVMKMYLGAGMVAGLAAVPGALRLLARLTRVA